MKKTAIVYGSTTGNCESAAQQIASAIPESKLYNIASGVPSDLADYELIIIGSSTWGYGDLQDDWQDNLGDFAALDLSGKEVAFFGTGDQEGYPDTFCDAVGLIKAEIASSGAKFVGQIPDVGYEIQDSKAREGSMLIGLLLDEDNQSGETAGRIASWVKTLG